MPESSEDQQIELIVQGMTWMGWEPKVVGALEELPGVKKASASHPGKMAVVKYDPGSVTVEQMCQNLFKAGYVASPNATNRTTQAVSHDESREKSDHRADDFICYCFEYTRHDIEQDFIKNGRSLIMENIAAEKKKGGCDCANKNPKGKWCLSDVRRAVDKIMEKLAKSPWL